MKMVKGLLLGSVAALIASSGAQAADLPVKAKAVEYVKVCSLYGPGFYFIPGTDTCIKLGGYLRVDVLANTNSDASGNTSGAGGAQNRFTNGYTWRSREDLNVDTRTATEYGVVRTYFDAVFSWTSDTYGGQGNGATVYSPIGTAAAPNNATSGGVAAGTVGVYYAFIQFAGFTMGKAVSQFSAPWTNYPGNNFDGLVGGGGTVTGVNQFTYTAQFGNGVSLSLSAQDQSAYYQAGVQNLGVLGTGSLGAYGASDYAGTIAPDLVAAVKVDQAWGLFQASFAAHDNHAAYYGGTELTGHPDDKWGWAGQLALSIKNIPTGPGDTINIQGVYTDGATRYNIQDLSIAGAITYFGGTNVPGAYQSIGFGMAPDSVFVNGGQQQLIQTWGMRGAYVHNWSPNWNTSVYGAYAGIRYNDTAKSAICGPGGNGVGGSFGAVFGTAGLTSCNPDYNIAQIGTQTQWTPVKNLTFSADLTYTHLDQKYAGTITYPGSASIGKPATVYELKDQDTVTLLLRAQRNW
ncbi:porin [Bradyrhizobium septentrionale]|uniref:Porin n=1 Tax=Bradyrhizobium septentrionale TaxID=1404411 RepID=A0A974A0N5_9BRAD|nr:porin [Bradyrhizobium septentrionale]UGY12184.1 porin [Bradyrhizobium septentrionale]UGY29371.1 porin [Bradyrhizobium septentrionale]